MACVVWLFVAAAVAAHAPASAPGRIIDDFSPVPYAQIQPDRVSLTIAGDGPWFHDVWRLGLSHDPVRVGAPRFPVFAYPMLMRGGAGIEHRARFLKEGDWALVFPLRGAWAGFELKEAVAVQQGYRFSFGLWIGAERVGHSRWRPGVFWEDAQGQTLGESSESAGTTGPWMGGDHAEALQTLEGRVPPGAVRARPYFFLAGDARDLQGHVWITRAEFELRSALSVEFEKPLLVFPRTDPVRWRLRSRDREAGTYRVVVGLKGLDADAVFPEQEFRAFVRDDGGELLISSAFGTLLDAAGRRGGRYEAAFSLERAFGGAPIDALTVVLACLGEGGGTFVGEIHRVYYDFAVRDLLVLERAGVLAYLVRDLPVLRARARFDRVDPEELSEVGAGLFTRYGQVRFAGSIPVTARPEDPRALADFVGKMARRVEYWEVEGGEDLAPYMDAVKGALEPGAFAEFGAKGAPRSWASFSTADGGHEPLAEARWAVVQGPDAAVIPSVLNVSARGGHGVLLAESRTRLIVDGACGASPTALYGPWRTMARLLGGAFFVARTPRVEGAETFYFRHADGDVLAFFSAGGPLDVALEAAGPVTEIDAWGNRTVLVPRDGAITVRMEPAVKYLMGLFPGVRETVRNLQVIEASGAEGQTGRLALSVENVSGWAGRLVVTEPNGGASIEVELSPAGVTEFVFDVSAPAAARIRESGAAHFDVAFVLEGEERLRERIHRSVAWGTREFELRDVRREREQLSFALHYKGKRSLESSILVAAVGADGMEIVWSAARVAFSPAAPEQVFAVRLAGAPSVLPLNVMVSLPADARTETFAIPRGPAATEPAGLTARPL